jgi:hypothetical protein
MFGRDPAKSFRGKGFPFQDFFDRSVAAEQKSRQSELVGPWREGMEELFRRRGANAVMSHLEQHNGRQTPRHHCLLTCCLRIAFQ